MEKLGYSWETLHKRYPRLIYASASGFGHTGPYRSKPAYDMVVQGMGGIMSVTGHPDTPPTRVGSSIGDIVAGIFTTVGISSALYHRAQTGEATCIDVAMLDCQVAILENAIIRYAATGKIPGPIGSRHPSIAPFEAYETADGHIIIAAGNDHLFREMSATIDRPDLATDPRFTSNELRCEHVDELRNEMEGALRTQPSAYWLSLLEKAGIPSGPINNIEQVLQDPQVIARNMIVEAHDPAIGRVRMPGNPVKMSAFPDPHERAPAPDLDADRAAILEFLKSRRAKSHQT